MASQIESPAAQALPDYLQAARPNPVTNRAPWYKNTAPTYAGIFLWFVFWNELPYGGGLNLGGLKAAFLGIVLAGLICYLLFYLAPGLLGMKTGLPLYIVGTSTFGATGGLLMPGLLMGVLQFGWLGVNTFYSCQFLAAAFRQEWASLGLTEVNAFRGLCVLWALGAAFVGLKGIQYVAKVATLLPLIPLAVLVFALVRFVPADKLSAFFFRDEFTPRAAGGIDFSSTLQTVFLMMTYVVGFFATAGAAGVDFGMNNRDRRDVHWGGIVGILIAILVTGGIACAGVAGAHLKGTVLTQAKKDELAKERRGRTETLREGDREWRGAAVGSMQELAAKQDKAEFTLTNNLEADLENWNPGLFRWIMIGLTLAAFPGACFSSFIAANSFKTVMPRVNSFLSVGLGAVVSIVLAVTEVAGNLAGVFVIIGASFGPICGAMAVDYLMAGGRWTGPRRGFNPAGWIAWLVGFVVGIMPNLQAMFPDKLPDVPAAPVAAFLVGALVYWLLSTARIRSAVVPYAPAAAQQV